MKTVERNKLITEELTDLEYVSIYSVLRFLTSGTRLRYDSERESDLKEAARLAKQIGFDDIDEAFDFLRDRVTTKTLLRAEATRSI